MHFNFVPMLPMHLDDMAELEQVCFSEPWSRAMLAEELHNEYATYIVAEDMAGRVAGYCGFHAIIDEGYITNIAVLPVFRRAGLGNALLERVEQNARRSGLCRLTLEVRVSNMSARALYEKRGFKQAGIRKNYYYHPSEDGILMEKLLTGNVDIC